MSKQEKAMTKDRLIGMQVIDSEGNGAGTIKDIAFTVGKVGMTLIIEKEKGNETQVQWEQIQAASDYVLLKPQAARTQALGPQSTAQFCPTCGEPLTYIQQYQRWYCYRDKKYV